MSPFYITLIHNQGHHLAFPTDPDHLQPLISCITLTMQPLISDAMGASLSLLVLGESPKNVRAEFGSEGVESREVSELPSEEAEVSERPLKGVRQGVRVEGACSSVGDCWKGLSVTIHSFQLIATRPSPTISLLFVCLDHRTGTLAFASIRKCTFHR